MLLSLSKQRLTESKEITSSIILFLQDNCYDALNEEEIEKLLFSELIKEETDIYLFYEEEEVYSIGFCTQSQSGSARYLIRLFADKYSTYSKYTLRQVIKEISDYTKSQLSGNGCHPSLVGVFERWGYIKEIDDIIGIDNRLLPEFEDGGNVAKMDSGIKEDVTRILKEFSLIPKKEEIERPTLGDFYKGETQSDWKVLEENSKYMGIYDAFVSWHIVP
jgi:hypothetical protein